MSEERGGRVIGGRRARERDEARCLAGTHVVVTADSPGACVASGGTFGVANVQSAGTQLPIGPGPLATHPWFHLEKDTGINGDRRSLSVHDYDLGSGDVGA